MKLLFISIFLLVSLIEPNYADTYIFPPGEVPSISLIEAVQMCEKMAADAGLGKFNPLSVSLMGGKNHGTKPIYGTWVFQQITKSKVDYSFHIRFTANSAFLIRMPTNRKQLYEDYILAAYRIEGKELIRVAPPQQHADIDIDDPFTEEPTAKHTAPKCNKKGKPSPIGTAPAPPSPSDKPVKPNR